MKRKKLYVHKEGNLRFRNRKREKRERERECERKKESKIEMFVGLKCKISTII